MCKLCKSIVDGDECGCQELDANDFDPSSSLWLHYKSIGVLISPTSICMIMFILDTFNTFEMYKIIE